MERRGGRSREMGGHVRKFTYAKFMMILCLWISPRFSVLVVHERSNSLKTHGRLIDNNIFISVFLIFHVIMTLPEFDVCNVITDYVV